MPPGFRRSRAGPRRSAGNAPFHRKQGPPAMSPRLAVFIFALVFQAPCVLLWVVSAWRRPPAFSSASGRGCFRGRERVVCFAGAGGALCGLAYAIMTRDPVFFLGQAIFLGLVLVGPLGRCFSLARAGAPVAEGQPEAAAKGLRAAGERKAATGGINAGKAG